MEILSLFFTHRCGSCIPNNNKITVVKHVFISPAKFQLKRDLRVTVFLLFFPSLRLWSARSILWGGMKNELP